jgi:hypothetical protein
MCPLSESWAKPMVPLVPDFHVWEGRRMFPSALGAVSVMRGLLDRAKQVGRGRNGEAVGLCYRGQRAAAPRLVRFPTLVPSPAQIALGRLQ